MPDTVPDTVNDSPCPCGSARSFSACCGPFLEGAAQPPTAESLMRSRYSAFVRNDVGYIGRTVAGEAAKGFSASKTARMNADVEWTGLEIHEVVAGGEQDSEGEVHFTAFCRIARSKGKPAEDGELRERSLFARDPDSGHWRYVGQVPATPRQTVTAPPKVGRNEPCPCGSGAKYKRCCGA